MTPTDVNVVDAVDAAASDVATPDATDLPDVPDLPDATEVPDVRDAAVVPDVADATSMPDASMPDMTSMPDATSDGARDASPETGDAAGPAPSGTVRFRNGMFWTDTAGNRIEAHGAGLLKVGDLWYWFGEDKSGNSSAFKAVNVYASRDLSAWEFRKAVLSKTTATELADANRIIERPKVIYNDTTKQFVMWAHWDGKDYAEAKAAVFTSATVDGPYTYRSSFQPMMNMSRDCTLFKDDDGRAYFISAANHNADLIVYALTDDYLGVKRQVATLWAGSSREAPALFKQGGVYFLVTSAATGWDSNQAMYATASAIGGPWSTLQKLGDASTFDSQPAFVLPVTGTAGTTYIYAGDRWQDPDLQSSKYIWLPLVARGTRLILDNHQDWNLDLATGKWWANDGFLPQRDWRLLSVDSEETSAEDGRATNVFDDTPSTIWHTQYTGTAAPYPHELRIDMGASYVIEGLRALPRQDDPETGLIAAYELYLGTDGTTWGTPAASGTFSADRDEKRVMFTARTARYLRFVALREAGGRAYASLASLDLIGRAAP